MVKANQFIVASKNRQKDDYYSTPPLAVKKLIEVEKFKGKIFEPCCGQGHISKELQNFGFNVESSDLLNRNFGKPNIDFLLETSQRDNVITNPPFKLATEMVRHSQNIAKYKTAMLLKLTFLEGVKRFDLFKEFPPKRVWVFSKRITIQKNGDSKIKGGMICFAWFIWTKNNKKSPKIGWLI